MSFSDKSEHKDFSEGDIFYTFTDAKYHVFKLLKIQAEFQTFHVQVFEALSKEPSPNELAQLGITVYHAPIAMSGFNKPVFLSNQAVSDDDLIGYFEYIKQTQNVDELVKYAQKFYKEGYELTTQKNHTAAIQKYSKAIDLVPSFHEAIDNRAFCYMDLAQWNEAIEGFKGSLNINPNSLLAIFSIGECYFRLKEYPNAKSYFEQAIQIAPEHPKPKEFLQLTNQLMNA